jgi:glycosyltransferase involved in cell wall biosynthesis
MIIVAGPKLTGPAKGILQLIEYYSKNAISFYLYNFKSYHTYPAELISAAAEKKIRIYLLNQNKKAYISVILQAIKEVRRKRINIIQTHGFKPNMIGLFVKFVTRTKWLCFMHGTTCENIKVKIYHFVDRFIQRFADRVVLITEAQRNKIFRGQDISRVTVVHNAVDVRKPVRMSQNRKPLDQILKLPESALKIVVVARLSPEKGIDVFLDAFAELTSTIRNASAIIVGDGNHRSLLEQKAQTLLIDKSVHFVGYSATPGDFMIDADVIVLPSRSEGMPNVALEAMALGKPVIATAVGGMSEIIKNGKSGLLVSPDDPNALAFAMKKLFRNKSLADKISLGGYLRIQEKFAVKFRCEKILSLYRDLLSL